MVSEFSGSSWKIAFKESRYYRFLPEILTVVSNISLIYVFPLISLESLNHSQIHAYGTGGNLNVTDVSVADSSSSPSSSIGVVYTLRSLLRIPFLYGLPGLRLSCSSSGSQSLPMHA